MFLLNVFILVNAFAQDKDPTIKHFNLIGFGAHMDTG